MVEVALVLLAPPMTVSCQGCGSSEGGDIVGGTIKQCYSGSSCPCVECRYDGGDGWVSK